MPSPDCILQKNKRKPPQWKPNMVANIKALQQVISMNRLITGAHVKNISDIHK